MEMRESTMVSLGLVFQTRPMTTTLITDGGDGGLG